jgi:uncharacterized iron-regulated membrane protein
MPRREGRQQLLMAKGKTMQWLRWHLEGNLVAIMCVLLIAVGLALMAMLGTSSRSDNPPGFGPEWECTSHLWGGPTCIKKAKP